MITTLSPAECAARLTAAIDPESYNLRRIRLGLRNGSKPVLGEVVEGRFALRKRIMGRNSFATFATGTLRPEPVGTLIEGRFSAHPDFRLGYKAWGCLMFFIGGPIILGLSHSLISGAARWRELWSEPYQPETAALLFLVAPALMFAVGRFAAQGEDDFLWQFLVRTLEARAA